MLLSNQLMFMPGKGGQVAHVCLQAVEFKIYTHCGHRIQMKGYVFVFETIILQMLGTGIQR